MRISAVVLTKNDEKNIEKCLSSLFWCDEIIIVDDYSKDSAFKKIKNLKFKIKNDNSKLKVYKRHLNGDFSAQRNFGLRKAKGDWVLFVDADERVTKALALEIKNTYKKLKSENKQTVGFYIKRKDFIFGGWLKHGEVGRMKLLRLAKKDAGQWEGCVHERWKVRGETRVLKNSLHHYPHPTVSEFLKKINQYSSIRASELYCQGRKTNFFEIFAYPTGKFFKNFFYYFGFLDGLPGFLHAVFMSFHSFLVRGKLWLMHPR